MIKAGRASTRRRDPALTNALLEQARELAEPIGGASSGAGDIAALADSIFTGDYAEARRLLERLSIAQPGGGTGSAGERVSALREALPRESLAEAQALRALLRAVRSSSRLDPFDLQASLSELVHGVLDFNIPEDLNDLQVWLTKKASAEARRRGLARQARPTGVPVQEHRDCWLHGLYFLPIPELDALRGRVSYARFLDLVEEEFSDREIRFKGLSLERFEHILGRLGLKLTPHLPREDELAKMLDRRHAVIAAILWFDKDVADMGSLDALSFCLNHIVVITGWEPGPEGALFSVRDPLLTRVLRFTKAELDIMSLVVHVIERGDTVQGGAGKWLN